MNENDLWNYSLQVYGNGPAAEACLLLQDNYNADVNLLLYLAWIARRHNASVNKRFLSRMTSEISDLSDGILPLLRSARKKIDKNTAPEDLLALRKHILALELEAEKHVQNRLFELTPDMMGWCRISSRPVRQIQEQNLEEYALYLDTSFPGDCVMRLLEQA